MICGTKSSVPSTPPLGPAGGRVLPETGRRAQRPAPRGGHAAAVLLTSPIRSLLPAPLTWVTLSFPAAGTFGQLSQLLTILGGSVCGFLEPSFVRLPNLEGRGG